MVTADTEVFVKGAHLRVDFLKLANGRVPAREFLESFTSGDKQYNKSIRLVAAIELFANSPPGQFTNREVFRKLQGSNISEFKAHQLRMFCFFLPDRRLILEFGVIKKRDEADPADIRRAEEWRAAFLEVTKNPQRRFR